MSTRQRVREHVSVSPGVHFNELTRRLDIATGQAQYHLRKLARAGEIEAATVRGRTHYFTPAYDPWEQRLLALSRRDTTREIIAQLLADGQLSAGELTDRLGVARSTVAWHVSSLVEASVATKSYGDRGHVLVSLTRPSETRRLLERVDPALTDRQRERFVCRIDDSTVSSAGGDDD